MDYPKKEFDVLVVKNGLMVTTTIANKFPLYFDRRGNCIVDINGNIINFPHGYHEDVIDQLKNGEPGLICHIQHHQNYFLLLHVGGNHSFLRGSAMNVCKALKQLLDTQIIDVFTTNTQQHPVFTAQACGVAPELLSLNLNTVSNSPDKTLWIPMNTASLVQQNDLNTATQHEALFKEMLEDGGGAFAEAWTKIG